MTYQIIVHETKKVDIDNISYQVDLIEQESKKLAVSVGATMIISANAWHIHDEEALEEIGVDASDLQDALEERSYSIDASLPTQGMSRLEVIQKIEETNPWFNGDMINLVSATDQICKLLDMGVGFGNISLYRAGESRNQIEVRVHHIDEVEKRIMKEYISTVDDLIGAVKRDEHDKAKQLIDIKESTLEKLSLIGSSYTALFGKDR